MPRVLQKPPGREPSNTDQWKGRSVAILRPDTPSKVNRPRTAVQLRNVRPVNPPAPTRQPGPMDPVLSHIARTQPIYTNALVDGRPVRIYIERGRVRLRWGRATAITAGVAGALVALLGAGAYLAGVAVQTVEANRNVIVGALVAAVVVAFVLRRILGSVVRAGACCTGLHCSGCPHR